MEKYRVRARGVDGVAGMSAEHGDGRKIGDSRDDRSDGIIESW